MPPNSPSPPSKKKKSRRRAKTGAKGETEQVPAQTQVLDGVLARERGAESGPRYRVMRRLGEGAVGVVERVYDTRLGRIVARKTLHERLRDDANSIRTFANEARILGHLDHGGVIPIFEAWMSEEGLPVYTMREIDGESLSRLLRVDAGTATATPLPLERTLSIITQIAEALSHAHGRGVLHLDLKPQNIVVLPHGEVILVDWGSASIFDAARYAEPLSGVEAFVDLEVMAYQSDDFIVGTPRYMSPEQTDQARSTLTPASDVFSLGLLFYLMLAGRLPFQGESLEELLFHIRETPAPDPREINPGIHARLSRLVMSMLEKDPAARPEGLGAVLAELAAFRGTAAEFPLRRFEAGTTLFSEGEEGDAAFVIIEGEVEAWTRQEGERRVLGRHLAGESIGELSLLRDAPRSASATALTDVTCREIRRDALSAETERLSPWVLAILSGAMERFVDRSERLVELLGRGG